MQFANISKRKKKKALPSEELTTLQKCDEFSQLHSKRFFFWYM